MAERSRDRRSRNRRSREYVQENKKSGKTGKRIAIGLGVLVLAAAAGAGGYCAYDRIMDGKTMGCKITVYGVNVSWMTVDDAAAKLEEKFQDTMVNFEENGKEEYGVSLKDAGYSLDESALKEELQRLKDNREPCKILFEEEKNYTVPYQVQWNDAQMKEAFSSANIGSDKERIASTDAYITYNESTKRYEIVPSVLGTVIDNAKLQNKTQEQLNNSFKEDLIQSKITVTVDESVYQDAQVTEDQNELNQHLSELNGKLESYENAEVTYEFGSVTDVLDSETIQSWVQVDDEKITLDENAMRDYISNLSAKYNTQYVPRYFTTSNGNQVVIENNEYGYWIDEDGEYEQLCSDLESGQPVSREPVYKTAGNGRDGDDDLINGYVEVDLTSQHLWFYYQGEKILDSDVVTGQPVGVNKKTGEQEDWSTYEGSYPIAYTEHPSTLSSDIYGYEVEVQYWMPFVYGQGLHDASWRSSFGGNIYQTDGSHGCVNLPPDVAATIYDYIDAGFPIILYK